MKNDDKLLGKKRQNENDGHSSSHRSSNHHRSNESGERRQGQNRNQPQQARLPIEDKKEDILNAIENNQVMIISGSTGCGKTTMVPVYLYERYGHKKNFKLLVTQPRRIATKAIAKRLSETMGSRLGGLVGYKIGRNDETSAETRIIIATTGLFYNIIIHQDDLAEYSHIILDEVHEREIDIDIVLIMMKYVLTKNDKIKLILMSATIQIDLFAKYFSKTMMTNFLKLDHYAEVRELSEKDIYAKCAEALKPVYFDLPYTDDDKAPIVEIQRSPFKNEIFYLDQIANGLTREYEKDRINFDIKFHESQFNYFDKQNPSLNENIYQVCTYLIKAIALKCICQQNEKFTTVLVFLPGAAEIQKQNDFINKIPSLSNLLEVIQLHSNLNE
jgi:HrpA-like RNA helicase